MIESVQFVNYDGTSLFFNDDQIPFRRFMTDVNIRSANDDRMQEHGTWPSYTFWGSRTWVAEGDILRGSSAEYIQKRLDMLRVLRPLPHRGVRGIGRLKILFTGIPEVLISDCTLDGYPELPMEAVSPSRGDYQIVWRASDPRCYGENLRSTLAFAYAAVSGRTYSKTYNRTYAAAINPTNDVIVVNSGNTETYLGVLIYGPVTGPRLTLFRADGSQALWEAPGLTIAAGVYITVDFKLRTAVASNGQNVYDYAKGSEWWIAEPGNNTIRFSAFDAQAGSYALLLWQNAYMI